ncbi:cysteine desulfurase family protein [Natronosporangium hydrolyticum]|uniref:cysteine desulfurase family protein n=1 Tax=Natronosporangium hydrolyticum TaxID=2811111 RepID=UPI001EFA25C0|nr:aminotransferase class V-fold PLP-dependent enzyme [Natronosporangium hydrolyticum]
MSTSERPAAANHPAPVYFDAATAAPPHPVARQALLAALDDGWADPGKLYSAARRARQLLDAATEAVAATLQVRPDEVIFTGSGTAAVAAAIHGVFAVDGRPAPPGSVVHSAIEHSSVFAAAGDAAAEPVPVDLLGRLDLDRWRRAIATPGVRLGVLISASHEVGTVQPLPAALAAADASGVPVLVDAAQSLGRIPVPAGWSLLTGSARKWGGPPGVGLLVVRKGTRWTAPPSGAVGAALPTVVAAAAALRAAAAEASAEAARLAPLVDRIRERVAATVPEVEIVGDPVARLPNVVTFSCLYVDGEALLHELDRRGFAVSSGSSCTAETLRPSHVLAAMGVLSHGNIRLSLHRETTAAEVDRFLAELPEVVARLRAEIGV